MNIMQTLKIAAAPGLFLTVVLLAGCQTESSYQEQRTEKARKEYMYIVTRYVPEGKVYTLPECIESAMKNNLDLEVYDLRERVSGERKTAAVLGMLPEININYNYRARDNEPGSSSYNVYTGQQSLTPSKSSEKDEGMLNIDLALSVIDFGLAYFNSVQAQDRRLIVNSQRQRVAQNLVFNVARKYMQVAAAQYAIETTAALLDRTGEVEFVLSEIQKDKSLSPLRALDEKKRFINLEKRLLEYRTSYDNACIELKSLMGLTPNRKIKVQTKFLKKIEVVALPDVDELEKLALRERPELGETDIQQHISIVEARKAIIKMFPNVRMFADYNDSSNKYLYEQRWWSMGMRAAYDLLSIPKQVFEYRSKTKEVEAIEGKTMALSIAIMSQVRIAHAEIIEAKKMYDLDQRVFQSYNEHLQAVRKIYDAGEDYAEIDMTRLELETADTSINRAFTLSNYYLSYYRLLNYVGVDTIDPKVLQQKLQSIKQEKTPARQVAITP